MLPLVRYFLAISALVILLFAVFSGLALRKYAVEYIVGDSERHNVVLAQTLQNSLWPRFSGYLTSLRETDGDALRASPETQAMHAAVKSLTAGLHIHKVKIFSLSGTVLYSSQAAQIGQDEGANPGFLAARNGVNASRLTFRGSVDGFEKETFQRDLVSSYIPIRRADGTIEGVFELYADVTQVKARIQQTLWKLALGLLLAFLGLWGLLFFVVRHAARVLNIQYKKREAAEERLRDVAETSYDRLWETDEDFRFTSVVGQRGSEMSPDPIAAIGQTRWQLAGVDPSENSHWRQHYKDLLAHRSFRNFEYAVSDSTGKTVHWSVNGKPYFDEDGEFAGFRGSTYNVTERRQAQEELQASQSRLINALESISEGFVLYGPDGRLVICNSRFKAFYHYSGSEAAPGVHRRELGQIDIDRGTVVVARGREKNYIERRENLDAGLSESFVVELQDGRTILTHDRLTANGGIVSIQADITEQKRAQDALALAKHQADVANQAKSQFLASMSHELRTPLNAILGFADIISHQYLGPVGNEKYKEYAEDIRSSGDHLLSLVNDLLDISTIEAGKQSLVIEQLDSRKIVTECISTVEMRARDSGLELVTEVPDGLPPFFGGRRAIKQILLNLLSNAIRHTPAGGRVSVTVTASPTRTSFAVSDTGEGISPELLPEVTNPFTRGETDPHKSSDGWGLGLSITKSLIDLHGGDLDIKSTLGVGTTVTVHIPGTAQKSMLL